MDLSILLSGATGTATGLLGGFVLGAMFGHKLTAGVLTVLHGLENRLLTVEHALGLGAAPKTEKAKPQANHPASGARVQSVQPASGVKAPRLS
jgi:hypothetical protein